MSGNRTGWLLRAISSTVLAYIILRPVSSGNILYPLLALLAVSSLFSLITKRPRVSSEMFGLLGAILLVALYGTVIGVENPGLFQHATVWTLGPITFWLWAVAADSLMIKTVLFTSIWATIALSTVIILFVASQLGAPSVLPEWMIKEMGGRFVLDSGTTSIGLYGLSSLIAAAPMCIVAAFVSNHPLLPSRSVRVLAAILATSAALIGGRDGIVLVVVMVPLIGLLGQQLWKLKSTVLRIHPGTVMLGLGFIVALPFSFAGIFYNPALQRTWGNIVGFFEETGSQEARNSQINQLLEAWSDSFILGRGFGATLPFYSRSIERPWNFEMQYHMLLFQLGLVGVVLLFFIAFLATRTLFRAAYVRRDLITPLLVSCAGASGMLIGNATNPYLQAPGHMWAIWLPLMVANAALCSRPNRSEIELLLDHKNSKPVYLLK